MNKIKEFSNIKQKKRRYKLLYKKLIDLKKNVQNRLKIINFKKKKWRKFIESLQKTSNTKKQIFRFHDQSCDYVSKFQTRFKWNYKKTLQAQKRLNFYYGYLLKNYLNGASQIFPTIKTSLTAPKDLESLLSFRLSPNT